MINSDSFRQNTQGVDGALKITYVICKSVALVITRNLKYRTIHRLLSSEALFRIRGGVFVYTLNPRY
ncbi:MAG: hypothetical protein C4518_11825 [Desulfobacteraceae bacterium]|nr:MAG: hypothetical protein C4518_11825 [Desulfobacteraceae bacterium]